MKIIVIGAGLGGLAAAWTLRSRGVTVLESSTQVGGRMRSEHVDGATMELGAQFLSSRYTVVPALARSVGIALARVEPGTAVVREGRLRRFRSDRPLTAFTGGLLPWRAAARAVTGLARVTSLTSGRSIDDLTAWADLDDEPAATWALRTLGPDVTQRLLEPTVHGFYFQSMADNSAVLPAAVAAFGARPGSTLTIDGGLGRLPQALANHLDVRLGCPVRTVRREGGRAVVTTDSGDVRADRVIIAVPGPAASTMLRDADDAERRLMATPYSTGLLVGIPLSRPLDVEQLGGAYGVLVHPDEPTVVAALTVASRAHRRAATTDLVTVMLTHRTATELASVEDHVVAAVAMEALEALHPGLGGLLPSDSARARVVRHPHAMPSCPPGHAAAVAAYRAARRTTRQDDPVVLAGDYLGFPWTDSAAATGIWAAHVATAGTHGP